jgi:hypothetical protein
VTISDPDGMLAKLGFGRAHHRVLHFVNRNQDGCELWIFSKSPSSRLLRCSGN